MLMRFNRDSQVDIILEDIYSTEVIQKWNTSLNYVSNREPRSSKDRR